MNTTQSVNQLAVKAAFVLKSGKRGRPVRGDVGELFNIVSQSLNGDFVLAHAKRPNKSWTFTAAQVAEWFNDVRA